MSAIRWIGGFIGWAAGGALGAIIGYLVGTLIEVFFEDSPQPGSGDSARQRRYSSQEQQNSFFISLLVLSSAVIRADGKTLRSETDFVKEFIRQNFGDAAAAQTEQILAELATKEINIYEVGAQVAGYMNYSQRLQLFHYLTQIAIADGEFSKSEKELLEKIAGAIRISQTDAASIIAMFYKDTDSAYEILGIEPTATDDEVRKAYRRMAMKNHPDIVATLGPEVQKAAAEKFRMVQEAYETIKAERGMS